MNPPTRKPEGVRVPPASATCRVRFGKEARPDKRTAEEKPVGRVPRVTRLLALAHRIDGMIRSGELKNWAEAAGLIGVTRARMTQIANLLLLAPGIQVAILERVGNTRITERDLRLLGSETCWHEQQIVFLNCILASHLTGY